MSDIALGFSLHGCLSVMSEAISVEARYVPWLNYIEQHWVRHPLPYIKRVRMSEFSDPNWVEIL